MICDKPTEKRTRGLCRRHHVQFIRRKAEWESKTPGLGERFDQSCVDKGLILESQRETDKNGDPFSNADLAMEQFLAQQLAADLQKTPEEVEAELAQQELEKPKRKGKSRQ